MPIKNFLVALDGTPASNVAFEAAIAMQKAYDAHLTGYVAMSDRPRGADSGFPWIPAAIRKTLEAAANDAVHKLEEAFKAQTCDLPSEKIHLIDQPRATDTSIAEASRFFDVTLVGIPDTGATSGGLHPDRIALLSGRPVLAFPEGIDTSSVARKAMVAWDGSRAAARALNSAMRLLDTKDTVTVITVGEPPKAEVDVSGLDPKTALVRQGLSASWINVAKEDEGVAETILGQAERLGAELLIMRAFEHSKFREDLFGGVTHDVMTRTTIPVFLAH